ncbi:MAG: hypothetical protein Q9212_002526 [Teloschistes hypoglaucus]
MANCTEASQFSFIPALAAPGWIVAIYRGRAFGVLPPADYDISPGSQATWSKSTQQKVLLEVLKANWPDVPQDIQFLSELQTLKNASSDEGVVSTDKSIAGRQILLSWESARFIEHEVEKAEQLLDRMDNQLWNATMAKLPDDDDSAEARWEAEMRHLWGFTNRFAANIAALKYDHWWKPLEEVLNSSQQVARRPMAEALDIMSRSEASSLSQEQGRIPRIPSTVACGVLSTSEQNAFLSQLQEGSGAP